jgi:hypothetical protein
MQEFPGTVFILTHEARYKWRHGLAPVSACRVSVTCRFFKTEVYSNYRESIGAPRPLKSWQQRRLKHQQQAQESQQSQQSQQAQTPQESQASLTTNQTTQRQPQQLKQTQSPKPKPEPSQPQPQTPQPDKTNTSNNKEQQKKQEEIHVELCLNKDPHQTKPALVNQNANFKQLVDAAKNKLRVKAKQACQRSLSLPSLFPFLFYTH